MLSNCILNGCTFFCLWLMFSVAAGDCPIPKKPLENGQFIFQKETERNITMAPEYYLLSFKCFPGYILVGSKAMFCFHEKWSSMVPICFKMQCPDPPTVQHSYYVLTKGLNNVVTFGSKVKYLCYAGFQLQNGTVSTLTCTFDTKGNTVDWIGETPRCIKKESCDDPGLSNDGMRKGDCCFVGHVLKYSCKDGYQLVGENTIECLSTSKWSSDRPLCRQILCKAPKHLRNGKILELASTNIRSFPSNFQLTYTCNDGFRLIGNSWRFCGQNGWNGKEPYCEAIKCPNLRDPEYGRSKGHGFEIGSKRTFWCNSGFQLIGSFERYCMPNGQWSGQMARCDSPNNYCPDPGIPISGTKNSSDYSMGSIVGFRCQRGFMLIGSEARECLPNRTWSGTEAKCMGSYEFDNSATVRDIIKAVIIKKAEEQKKKQKEYYEIKHGLLNKIVPAGRVLDINFPGRLILFFIFDTSGSIGEHNFKKSVEFAKALIKRVGISMNGARAGAVTFSYKAEIQFLPVNYNTTKDVLDALDRINYTGGGTAARLALTSVKTDMIPLTKELLGERNQKSVIFILTDGKTNMAGDPQVEAESLKRAGVEIYSIGITGDILKNSLYKISSEPKEEHVFILKNYVELAWLVDEITNGTIDYSTCGVGHPMKTHSSRIIGGNDAVDPWPWMAAIYFPTSTFSDEEEVLDCGGSIIDQNYILTAAHCLYNIRQKLRSESEVRIKLGLRNVTNQTKIQEFEVKKFCMHPKYNFGQIFDYDIALLRLARPMEFTAYVRPVCLPPRTLPSHTTFYKFKELAVATGWGHAGVIEKDARDAEIITVKQLKEVVLPIQSWERCMQSTRDNRVRESRFTERMFCAGDGKGGNDTCNGDSGGPLVQSQLDPGGNIYWTQVGIVSWGLGCGVANTYGYYTHVQKLRSWIDETIEAMNINKCRNDE